MAGSPSVTYLSYIFILRIRCQPLHLAAGKGHLSLAKVMLSHGASVNAMDFYNATPIMYAMEEESLPMLELLVAAGADINDDDVELIGGRGLMAACSLGHTEVVDYFVNKFGPQIIGKMHMDNIRYSGNIKLMELMELMVENYNRPLHNVDITPIASIQMVQYLLSKGVRIQRGDQKHSSMASTTNIEILPILLQAGANIDERNDDGDTPLMRAILFKHYDLATWLINQGADINASNPQKLEFGPTPIAVASQMQTGLPLVKLLFDRGAVLDWFGSVPFGTVGFHAHQNGALVAVHGAAAKAGADPQKGRVGKQMTVLHKAGMWMQEGGFKREGDVPEEEEYPLSYEEIWKQKRECVELLVCQGVDVNALDHEGRTPVDVALPQRLNPGAEEWIGVLMGFGATSSLRNVQAEKQVKCYVF
ncbi:hypothetical protein HDV00_006585 [Rhizophlyctis rosea]|nr:hypothetical protein HDV00_006585 [Rhizophlyctis rosea]